jgi:hypothetical protein
MKMLGSTSSGGKIRRTRTVSILATAAAVALLVSVAAPAQAEGTETGSRNCTSYIKVQSTTSGYAPSYLLVAHSTNHIDGEWAYSGYHSSISTAFVSSWKAYTNFTLISASALCSGIV